MRECERNQSQKRTISFSGSKCMQQLSFDASCGTRINAYGSVNNVAAILPLLRRNAAGTICDDIEP